MNRNPVEGIGSVEGPKRPNPWEKFQELYALAEENEAQTQIAQGALGAVKVVVISVGGLGADLDALAASLKNLTLIGGRTLENKLQFTSNFAERINQQRKFFVIDSANPTSPEAAKQVDLEGDVESADDHLFQPPEVHALPPTEEAEKTEEHTEETQHVHGPDAGGHAGRIPPATALAQRMGALARRTFEGGVSTIVTEQTADFNKDMRDRAQEAKEARRRAEDKEKRREKKQETVATEQKAKQVGNVEENRIERDIALRKGKTPPPPESTSA